MWLGWGTAVFCLVTNLIITKCKSLGPLMSLSVALHIINSVLLMSLKYTVCSIPTKLGKI